MDVEKLLADAIAAYRYILSGRDETLKLSERQRKAALSKLDVMGAIQKMGVLPALLDVWGNGDRDEIKRELVEKYGYPFNIIFLED